MTRRLGLALMAAWLTLAGSPARADDLYEADKAWVLSQYELAIKLYEAPARQGNPVAQRRLGDIYRSPYIFDPPDYATAARWYAMAAAQGDDLAQDSLALLYRDGAGVPRDDAEALKWLRRAAMRDNYMAQYHLGQMYQSGRGVAQDYVHAYVWFSLSAVFDPGNIAAARDDAARFLTPQQIVQARKLAMLCQISAYRNCD